jgi:hypothetical protein
MARRGPVTVQALVTSRLAYGYALVGDADRVHAAHGRARELAEHPTGHRPRWAYYVRPEFVDAASGYYLVSLAMACSHNSRRHLGNGVILLTPEAMAAPDYWSPRDALLGGTKLVTAYLGLGEPGAGVRGGANRSGAAAARQLTALSHGPTPSRGRATRPKNQSVCSRVFHRTGLQAATGRMTSATAPSLTLVTAGQVPHPYEPVVEAAALLSLVSGDRQQLVRADTV